MPATLERFQIQLYLLALGSGVIAGFIQSVAYIAEKITMPSLALLLWATFMSIPLNPHERMSERRSLGFTTRILCINFLVVPLISGVLVAIFPVSPAISFAVFLVLLAPCIDYVVVFCGLAGGNSQRLLRTTPLLLGTQAVAVPAYLWMFKQLNLWEMEVSTHAFEKSLPAVAGALAVILFPLLTAWVLQKTPRQLQIHANSVAQASMVPLMMLVLFCTVAAHIAPVVRDAGEIMWLVGLYLTFTLIMGSGIWKFTQRFSAGRLPVEERKALVFSGVTRNALVILPVALALARVSNQPLLPIAVMTQTLVELFVMVALVAVLKHK